MTQGDLEARSAKILGSDIRRLSTGQLRQLITVCQHSFDLVLNELERRGALAFHENGAPVVPYESDFVVETILDAERHPARAA